MSIRQGETMKKKPWLLLLLVFLTVTFLDAIEEGFAETESQYPVPKKRLLRVIDTKEAYGKYCEFYRYIAPGERLKLIREKEFMLGDLLTESLHPEYIEPEYLLESNLTKCEIESTESNIYNYKEEIEYLGEHVVSIGIYEFSYGAGAAHGNSHISYYIYEREKGMKLRWEDLFAKNEAFNAYVLDRVRKELANERFISVFEAEKNLMNFKNSGYFAIDDEGLTIQFGKYEIAPGMDGTPYLTVPKEVLKKYMSKEMYVKCFSADTAIHVSKAILK